MKRYPFPALFDGEKFAKRYGLDAFRGDFYADADYLYVPDTLPDDPPIFEPPDTPLEHRRRQARENIDDDIQLRAVIGLLVDELNILRAQVSLAPRTMQQMVAAYKNRISNGVE